jgi:hypothetical protein
MMLFLSSDHEPLRVSGNGYRMGLALVIDADIEDYSVTNGKFDGFKVTSRRGNIQQVVNKKY